MKFLKERKTKPLLLLSSTTMDNNYCENDNNTNLETDLSSSTFNATYLTSTADISENETITVSTPLRRKRKSTNPIVKKNVVLKQMRADRIPYGKIKIRK